MTEITLLEAVECAAYADFWAAASDSARNAYGITHRRIGDGVLLTAPGLDGSMMFNRLTGYGVTQPARAHDLDAAIAAFEAAGVRTWVIQVAPGAEGLAELAAARGLAPHPRPWVKFWRDAEPASERGLSVRPAEPGPDAEAFGAIACAAFGLPDSVALWLAALVGRPDWQCFLTIDDGAPVGTGALFVSDGIGWLGMGATLASHRGRGGQTAMLAARINAGIAAGCRGFTTETGLPLPGERGPSFRNIGRFFREAYRRPNLCRPLSV